MYVMCVMVGEGMGWVGRGVGWGGGARLISVGLFSLREINASYDDWNLFVVSGGTTQAAGLSFVGKTYQLDVDVAITDPK